jgi:hypothetical protein
MTKQAPSVDPTLESSVRPGLKPFKNELETKSDLFRFHMRNLQRVQESEQGRLLAIV